MNLIVKAILSVVLLMIADVGFADNNEAMVRAKAVLAVAPVADGHNDLPWVIRENFNGDVEGHDISVKAAFDTDIPRLRQGMVGTQFWSVYVPSTFTPVAAMSAQLEQINIAHRLIEQYPDDLAYADTVKSIRAAHQTGKIASLLGIEGGHVIANSLGALRSYYDLGVRYMTLTHFHGNDWADSATDVVRHEGLTQFGREVVREMNRMGMIVDLSHVSPASMHDALDSTEAPIMFSHSSAYALTSSPRNVPDDVLARMAANGGVVMVTFIPGFVNQARSEWEAELLKKMTDAGSAAAWDELGQAHREENGDPPAATLNDVANHIDYVAKVAGVDHVGIGGDFYGATGDELVVGLEDVSKYPDLIAELAGRGWSDEDLAKLTQENILRVLSGVEETSARLKAVRTPSLAKFEETGGTVEAGVPD